VESRKVHTDMALEKSILRGNQYHPSAERAWLRCAPHRIDVSQIKAF
jgi:hypothetical protein